MPLTFDNRRLLPPGIHEATLEEIERELALSHRRRTLFENLRKYVASVKSTGWACQVIVDGSFVMPSVPEPNDIDVILVMPSDWDWGRTEFRPFEYNVFDRKATKREYKIEVYAVRPGSVEEQSFLELFARVRIEWCHQFNWPEDARKGIVRVVL